MADIGYGFADDCKKLEGKNEWPELVGYDGDVASQIIVKENPDVYTAKVLDLEGMRVTMDYVCKRVRVWVDKDTNVVTRVPERG